MGGHDRIQAVQVGEARVGDQRARGDVPLPGAGRAGDRLGDPQPLLRLGQAQAADAQLLDHHVVGVFAGDVGLGRELVDGRAGGVAQGGDAQAVPERRSVAPPIPGGRR